VRQNVIMRFFVYTNFINDFVLIGHMKSWEEVDAIRRKKHQGGMDSITLATVIGTLRATGLQQEKSAEI